MFIIKAIIKKSLCCETLYVKGASGQLVSYVPDVSISPIMLGK